MSHWYRATGRVLRILSISLSIALLLSFTNPHKATAQQSPGIDLMLVLDGSASITPLSFEVARQFSSSLVEACFAGSTRIGVIQFAVEGTTKIESPLTSDKGAVRQAIGNMPYLDGRAANGQATDIQEGLSFARQQFDINGVAGNKQVIVLLTDGAQNAPGEPLDEATPFKAAGGDIFAIGVGPDILVEQLNAISSDPDSEYTYTVANFEALQLILSRLALGSCNVVIGDEDSVAAKSAKVIVSQQTSPRLSAAPGSVVSYTITVQNRGDGSAKNAIVTMNFDPALVRVLDATFSRDTAWVSRLNANGVEIQTGYIGSKNDSITATVRVQVLPGAALAGELGGRLSYRWSDAVRGGSGASNLLPLVIAASSADADYYPLATGSSERGITFASTIFVPLEPIAFWYNTPDGRAVAAGTLSAEDDGSIDAIFTPSDLPAGTYTMVAQGSWSSITTVGTFEIR